MYRRELDEKYKKFRPADAFFRSPFIPFPARVFLLIFPCNHQVLKIPEPIFPPSAMSHHPHLPQGGARVERASRVG